MHQFVIHNMAALTGLLSGPDRSYHNINHVNFCIARMEEAKQQPEFVEITAVEWMALEIAIWFHDAIYNAEAQMVSKGYSERESIEFMYGCGIQFFIEHGRAVGETHAEAQWQEFRKTLIIAEKLIQATAVHGEVPADKITALMVDIDLSSMGLAWKEFRMNTIDVVGEYALFRPKGIIELGNARFLKGLLAKERIFHTDWGKEKFEAQARWNIAHRIIDVLPPDEQH